MEAKQKIHTQKREYAKSILSSVLKHLPNDLKYAVPLAQEKGASSWLTVIPMKEHGFLHKSAFRDTLALRYGWLPHAIPADCSCGKPFSIEHSLSCPQRGFPRIETQ